MFFQKFSVLLSLTLFISWLAVTGCGDSKNSESQSHSNRQSVTQNDSSSFDQLTSGPAYFQYTQAGFDPKSIPTSVAKKNPHHTRESAGVVVMTKAPSGRVFVLLGHEKKNNLWSYMGGSVDQGDSYLKTAAKELHEETAGLYRVSEADLMKSSYDVFYSPKHHNYRCTFFIGLAHKPAAKMVQAAQTHSDVHFTEMKDYAWVQLDDLLDVIRNPAGNPFWTQTLDGGSKLINIDRYTLLNLQQADSKGILNSVF